MLIFELNVYFTRSGMFVKRFTRVYGDCLYMFKKLRYVYSVCLMVAVWAMFEN